MPTQDKTINWHTPDFQQMDNHPVVCISFRDAKAYADWLSRITGKTYRLPTEEEWEYAARAGSIGDYSKDINGNEVEDKNLDEYTWFLAKLNTHTYPVGGKKPNAFGLYDMHGNVGEWTCSNDIDYKRGIHNTCSKNLNYDHILRGSASGSCALGECAVWQHREETPTTGFNYYGFRVIQKN
jgi:formylglycine-generating enzyme required for sulfatase activity